MNAKDVNDIDRFDTEDVRKLVISDAENTKYYKHFYHVMSHQWQEEILGLFERVESYAYHFFRCMAGVS